MKTPTSALVQLLLLLTYTAHGVVAEPPSRTSVPQMGASSSVADAQERLSMLLANDGDPKAGDLPRTPWVTDRLCIGFEDSD